MIDKKELDKVLTDQLNKIKMRRIAGITLIDYMYKLTVIDKNNEMHTIRCASHDRLLELIKRSRNQQRYIYSVILVMKLDSMTWQCSTTKEVDISKDLLLLDKMHKMFYNGGMYIC
jgi:hypothetical protein